MASLWCFLLLSFSTLSLSQRTQFPPLPTPGVYTDGAFLVPSGQVQTFTIGSQMNVTWTSTYESQTLWLITNGDYANPYGLAIGISNTYFSWVVNDFGNNTNFFNFRVVDASSSSAQQKSGGFASAEFWISDPALVQSLATRTSSSTISTTTSTSTSTTASTTLNTTATTESPTTMSTTAAATAPATSTASPSPGSSVAIGAGVGVGVVAVALLAGFLTLFLRRRKKREEKERAANIQNYHQPPPGMLTSHMAQEPNSYGSKLPPDYKTIHEAYVPQGYINHYAAKAPHFVEPRELPGNPSDPTYGRAEL